MSFNLVSKLTPPDFAYEFAWKVPKTCAQPKIASCRIFTPGLWICAYLEDFDRDYYYGHYFTSGETRTHGSERGIMHEKSLCAHSLSRSSVKCPQLCATFPNTNVCARAQACMLGCCISVRARRHACSDAASPVATVCIRIHGYQPCALLQLHAVRARTS